MSSTRPQIHCPIRRSTSVIRMVFQHFGSVQSAHHVYLSFPSVASILSVFRTTLECWILCTHLICFAHLIPLVNKKKTFPSLPVPFPVPFTVPFSLFPFPFSLFPFPFFPFSLFPFPFSLFPFPFSLFPFPFSLFPFPSPFRVLS